MSIGKKTLAKLKLTRLKLRVSFVTINKFFYSNINYAIYALIVSVIFYELIYWFLNIGLAKYLLTSSLIPFVDKWDIFTSSYLAIFKKPFSVQLISLFLVSLLQGMTWSMLVYIFNKQKNKKHSLIKNITKNGLIGLLSVLSLGCAACGSSLITPILSLFISGTTASLADTIGFYAIVLALLASIFSIYSTSLKLSSIFTNNH